jgi:hypothetical protein
MPEGFFLRFFWGPRQEDVNRCARRLLRLLNGLKSVDPVFKGWKTDGMRKRKSDGPLEFTEKHLRPLVARGVTRGEFYPYRPFEDLGYAVSLLTDSYSGISLRVRFGCYSVYVHNSLIMLIPNEGTTGRRLLRVGTLVEMCRLAAETMNPDVGQVTSMKLLNAQDESNGQFSVGWFTYVAHRIRKRTPPVAGIEFVPVKKLGTTYIASRKRFSSDRPGDVERVQRLANALNASTPNVAPGPYLRRGV